VGALIDLGGGLGATVTHHAVLGVGVDSRLAERARALVDGAGGVDEPVGGGALVSCPGDALGRSPVAFPGAYRDLLIEVVRLLELAAGPVQRAGFRAAERVQPVGLGRAVEGVPIRSVARRTSSGLCEERGGELTSLIQTIRSRRWYAAASRTPATPAAPAVGW